MIKVVDYHKPKRKEKNLYKKSRVMAYAKVSSYEVVRYKDGTYGCTCPSKLYRRRRRCKHILAFREFEHSYNKPVKIVKNRSKMPVFGVFEL